jgi:NADPH2:quinone reductase
VVGLVKLGAWAQHAAVPTSRLAAIPDSVSDAQAATLPTAGMTALRALDVAGSVLAKRVLITGATGGVGRFAVQLARASGAHVRAGHRAPDPARCPGQYCDTKRRGHRHLPRRSVRPGLRRHDLHPQSLRDELTTHACATSDLDRLCTLLAEGRLDSQIVRETSWREPGAALHALLHRHIGSKIVRHVD